MVLDEWTGEIDASFARAVVDRLDAIAALGSERRSGSAAGPRPADPAGAPEPPWMDAEPVEQRLGEAVDSLLRLEGSAARIAEEARRVAAGGGDARRAWSVALLLGCAPGDDAAEAAAGTLRSPRMDLRAAATEAIALGRSPAIGPALARLAEDATPAACAAALEALRFRREAALAPCVVLLGHPDALVAAAAARCLATVPERKAAAVVLRRVLGDDPEEAVAVAAAEGLLSLGDAASLSFVRGELSAESASPSLSDGARVAYLRLLALGGDAEDLELFFRSLEASPRDALAVGWFGHPDLIDWLIGSLETANEARRNGPRGRASAPSLLGPSAFEIAAAQALGRIAGAPEGVPAPGLEASAWRAWWSRARARFTSGQKHRFGKPYAPEATIDELTSPAMASVRADAALELAIVSAGSASVETADWVARQRAVIAAARETIATAPWPPGTFPGRRLSR
ncbi:MAG: hypothetical protein QM820_00550 [Minicystis sp.]